MREIGDYLRKGDLAGVGIGLVAAFTLARLTNSLVYGVSPIDPVTFGTVSVFTDGPRASGLLCAGPPSNEN